MIAPVVVTAQMLNHIIEHEIVIRNLIGKFMPLISFIAANEGGKYDAAPVLRQTAVLSLCRAMSVSVSVCESSLPLLFTVLEREVHNAAIRTTIVIALGDLSFRFPNSVEPWTERMYARCVTIGTAVYDLFHLYAPFIFQCGFITPHSSLRRLRDADVTVRYNALMVITHLVLNDMIKVKGQVCHVAMSLNDDCESIRELAKLFFIKLSERSNNPVYNLLGDIISIFSQDSASETAAAADASAIDTGVGVGAVESEGGECIARAVTSKSTQGLALSVEQFQSTMQFMLSFVQKDK